MEMKKLHMGTMSYGSDSMDEIAHQLALAFGVSGEQSHQRQGSLATGAQLAVRGRRDMSSRVKDVVLSLALCHNVNILDFAKIFCNNLNNYLHRSLPLQTMMERSHTKHLRPMKLPLSLGLLQLDLPLPFATEPASLFPRLLDPPSTLTSWTSSHSLQRAKEWVLLFVMRRPARLHFCRRVLMS